MPKSTWICLPIGSSSTGLYSLGLAVFGILYSCLNKRMYRLNVTSVKGSVWNLSSSQSNTCDADISGNSPNQHKISSLNGSAFLLRYWTPKINSSNSSWDISRYLSRVGRLIDSLLAIWDLFRPKFFSWFISVYIRHPSSFFNVPYSFQYFKNIILKELIYFIMRQFNFRDEFVDLIEDVFPLLSSMRCVFISSTLTALFTNTGKNRKILLTENCQFYFIIHNTILSLLSHFNYPLSITAFNRHLQLFP